MTSPVSDIDDIQATRPDVPVALDDVGVRGIVRGIVLRDVPTTARFDVSCSLDGSARGAHMSRFHEAIDQALLLVGDDGADVRNIEVLAGVIAARAAELQDAPSATAHVRATVAQPRIAPESGRRTIDPYDVWATVRVWRTESGVRSESTLGVEASGMTACPCAQHLVRARAADRLREAGHDDALIEDVLALVPAATHNQRSTGSLELVVPGDGAFDGIADPAHVADLIRGSMSTGIHELLKRDDERSIVEAAHADPRFVEDCVRALLRDVATDERLTAALPGATVMRVRQTNHESIHAHDVAASRSVTLDAFRLELDPDAPPTPA